MTILQAWNERRKLRAEGRKLWAESDKLRAEGDKLFAEGDLVFINAVLSVHGNVEIKWKGDDAIVEGVRYEKAACEGKVVEIEG
jgi:hypothetical protein